MGKLGTSCDIDTSFGQSESTGRYLVSNNAKFGRGEIDTKSNVERHKYDPKGKGREWCEKCMEWLKPQSHFHCAECGQIFNPTRDETAKTTRVQNKKTHNACAYRYQLTRARERAAAKRKEFDEMITAMERES